MKIVLQRVNEAVAHLPGQPDQVVAHIGNGLVVFIGIEREDHMGTAQKCAQKVSKLRLFEKGDSMFGHSVLDVDGQVLCLFQMPMAADLTRGAKPNFSRAAPLVHARKIFDAFVDALTGLGVKTVAGPFQEHLILQVENRGPFTVPYSV